MILKSRNESFIPPKVQISIDDVDIKKILVSKKFPFFKFWDKIRNIIEKAFDSQPVHGAKYLSTKVKPCASKINKYCHDKKYPNMDSVFKLKGNVRTFQKLN